MSLSIWNRLAISPRTVKDQKNLLPTSLVSKRFSMQLQKTSSRPKCITTKRRSVTTLLPTSKNLSTTSDAQLPKQRWTEVLERSATGLYFLCDWGFNCPFLEQYIGMREHYHVKKWNLGSRTLCATVRRACMAKHHRTFFMTNEIRSCLRCDGHTKEDSNH